MNRLQQIVSDIRALKPIPQVAHKIMAAREDPDASMADLAAIISHDPMVTANILRSANSAFYGRSQKFDSVHQAIVFLGMDEIVDLVLLTSSAGLLKKAQGGYDLKAGELWRGAVSSAILARDLAEKKKLPDSHLVFTAALLKDIGKIVLAQYVGRYAEKIQALVQTRGYGFREAEKDVLGIDHAELGALIARVWQFSPRMVDIIANHHQPHQAGIAERETAVVYLSDVMCMMMGICCGADGLAYRFYKNVLDKMGVSDLEMQTTIAGFWENSEKIEALLESN